MTPGGVCEISIYDSQHGRKHALACGCELVDRVRTTWIRVFMNAGAGPDSSGLYSRSVSLTFSLILSRFRVAVISILKGRETRLEEDASRPKAGTHRTAVYKLKAGTGTTGPASVPHKLIIGALRRICGRHIPVACDAWGIIYITNVPGGLRGYGRSTSYLAERAPSPSETTLPSSYYAQRITFGVGTVGVDKDECHVNPLCFVYSIILVFV